MIAGDDFPNMNAARFGCPDRRGGLGSHTRLTAGERGACVPWRALQVPQRARRSLPYDGNP